MSTGFSSDTAVRARQAALVVRVIEHVRDLRSSGSAAMDLCWVAAGRIDAYFETGTRYWDRAAGALSAGHETLRETGTVAVVNVKETP